MINPKTFCISPWTDVRINSDGRMNFCHYANRDMIPLGENITDITVDQYFNGPGSVSQARQDLRDGKELKRCQHCYRDESVTDIGFRQRRNQQAAIFPGTDFEQSLRESTIYQEIYKPKQHPRFYHVSFSNICNMACVMCDASNSTMLATDWIKAGIISDGPIRQDWTDGPAWTEFLTHLLNNPEIMCLHVMGGEPMYHKKFKELIRFLVDNNHTDFHFTFVTNGSIYDAELIEMLTRFKSVQIEISIESFDRSNDYIRWPSDTGVIQQNILKYLQHRTHTVDIVLRTVPQLLSLMQYDNVLSFALDNQVVIDSNILYRPDYFQPAVLPADIKNIIRQRLQPYAELDTEQDAVKNINIRNRGRIKQAIAANATLILDLLDRPMDDLAHKRQALIKYLKRMDQVRRIDVRNYVPELHDFLTSNGYDAN
jgi:MoaA/NifB/PqqE/SkfB family radical SAM enzyme